MQFLPIIDLPSQAPSFANADLESRFSNLVIQISSSYREIIFLTRMARLGARTISPNHHFNFRATSILNSSTKMSQLPSHTLLRPLLPRTPICAQQSRNASLLRRPHRPYTFTQLVTLSDGSTYLTRTTSPQPVFRSTKDTRNHPMWQPSLDSLRNVEQDEAGRLRAFREKFGRGWDLDGELRFLFLGFWG